MVKPLSGHENFKKVIVSRFLNFLGKVSFSYSTTSNPLERFTAVSTLSANHYPKLEFKITLSTIIEISCFSFCLGSETHQYLDTCHRL